MASMNSGVSAYREDAVRRVERSEDKTMSDMGGLPSKYHGDGVPFPGHDAFALALGTLERPDDTTHNAEDRARASTAAAPDPTRVEFVTSGHDRLCIACEFCTDDDKPTPPAFLRCIRPLILKAARGAVAHCVTARSSHYGPLACGADGTWFVDALDSHRHRDSS
jgi:hypothetical protein